MCGIFGMMGPGVNARDMATMSSLLRHRGPDDEGFVFFGARSVPVRGEETVPEYGHLPPLSQLEGSPDSFRLAFGHRRLSIIDTSSSGHQPMSFYNGRYWVAYNGEIYNFRELRTELEGLGQRFESRCDTEVLLAAFAQWGTRSFERLLGMFAFALHDCAEEKTYLVRDRYGIKPLYYSYNGSDGHLIFASEIKAIRGVRTLSIDEGSLFDYLCFEKVPDAPRTFYLDVKLVEPGTYLEISRRGLEEVRWYAPPSPPPELTSLDDAFEREVGEFAHLFQDSVHAHLVADVPVAFCLSGGPDSSSIVSIVAKGGRFREPMHTFSAVFPGSVVDERRWIDVIVRDTGTSPHFVTPLPQGMLQELDRVCYHHDEPVANQTVYVEWCVMRLVHEAGIKVVLNGHGADELLSGYGTGIMRFLEQVRRQFGEEAYRRQVAALRVHNDYEELSYPDPLRPPRPGLMRRLSGSVWRRLSGAVRISNPRTFLLNREFVAAYSGSRKASSGREIGFNEELAEQFFRTSLPRQLVWADKSSMAFSIECRVPFMEKSVVEYAFSQVGNFKSHQGWTKWPLRSGMKGILHDDVRWRTTKFGYSIPTDVWHQACENRMAEMILDNRSLMGRYIDLDVLCRMQSGAHLSEVRQSLFRAGSSTVFMRLSTRG